MKMRSPGVILATMLLLAACMLLLWARTMRHAVAEQPPSPPNSTALQDAPPPDKTRAIEATNLPLGNPQRLRARVPVSELSAQNKAEFEKQFTEKIKPAVEHWCNTYAGHTPFRAEDVKPDNLRERVAPGAPFQGYAFVINGTTLDVCDDHGFVYVDYLMAPAAGLLLQIPKNPAPPAQPAVSREEILRLLKLDSGTDYPPDEIAIRPTSQACAMNGGVFVDVGESVNMPYHPLTKFSMVFGPDGNLACYGRSVRP